MTVETFFDHHPTPSEVERVLGMQLSKTDHLALEADQDTEFGDIYRLYLVRGNEAEADKYLQKITDPEYRALVITEDVV